MGLITKIINSKIINFYKWEALTLLASWGKRKKKHVGGKKIRKKKDCAFTRPSLELSPFMLSQLSNTVYQCIELS